MTEEQKAWDKMISDFCNEEEIKACKDRKDVYKVINDYLQEKYNGRAPKAHIANVADDVTESICLKMGLSD